MAWEQLKKTRRESNLVAETITISKHGAYFSMALRKNISATHFQIFVDKSKIGFKPCDSTAIGAYKLHKTLLTCITLYKLAMYTEPKRFNVVRELSTASTPASIGTTFLIIDLDHPIESA